MSNGGTSRARRGILAGILILAIAGVAVWTYIRFGPRTTPPGQPPFAELTPGGLGSFAKAFDGASDRTRVLVLLSPT